MKKPGINGDRKMASRRSPRLFGAALILSLCGACSDTRTVAPEKTKDAQEASTEKTTQTMPQNPNDSATDESATAPEGKVLRHAVFFSFKDTSSAEDIQRIVDAFKALPSKIPEIINFQWGVNNSPENLNDGFTHCFLLTFKDETGRAIYLPHPAHKAFGDVLRGHNDQVFVFDYWGTTEELTVERPLQHAVFFRFQEDAADDDIHKVEEAFAALPGKIDTIKRFEWGINNSPESHDAGFTHCFLVTFDSEEGRSTYLPHADHQAFVEVLKPILDAPRVLDFFVED